VARAQPKRSTAWASLKSSSVGSRDAAGRRAGWRSARGVAKVGIAGVFDENVPRSPVGWGVGRVSHVLKVGILRGADHAGRERFGIEAGRGRATGGDLG
jgi:hypothetical protein